MNIVKSAWLIPSGAGLGGGSGNAAGVLQVLNHIFRPSSTQIGLLPSEKLFELALELGSDVPFFLAPSPCEIRGRGEEINPLKKYPELMLVIMKPHLSISTPSAYQNCLAEKCTSFPEVKTLVDLQNHLNNQFETWGILLCICDFFCFCFNNICASIRGSHLHCCY